MSQKTRTALESQTNTLIADNTTQNITPSDVRTCLNDLADSIGLYQQITRAALQSCISGSTVETNALYQLTDAVSSKSIVVFGAGSAIISTLSFNLTDNQFGLYDISADTFTALSGSGSVIYSGAGTPSSGTGVNGDYYINSSNGDLYKKTGSSWGSSIMNLTGATGAAGTNGTNGT